MIIIFRILHIVDLMIIDWIRYLKLGERLKVLSSIPLISCFAW